MLTQHIMGLHPTAFEFATSSNPAVRPDRLFSRHCHPALWPLYILATSVYVGRRPAAGESWSPSLYDFGFSAVLSYSPGWYFSPWFDPLHICPCDSSSPLIVFAAIPINAKSVYRPGNLTKSRFCAASSMGDIVLLFGKLIICHSAQVHQIQRLGDTISVSLTNNQRSCRKTPTWGIVADVLAEVSAS